MCRRTREDLKAANKRITTMLADYGDVVPRRDYEGLERSFQALEAEHEQLKNDHITLMEEHRCVCVCVWCVHVCMYVCAHVCVCACMCTHTHTYGMRDAREAKGKQYYCLYLLFL